MPTLFTTYEGNVRINHNVNSTSWKYLPSQDEIIKRRELASTAKKAMTAYWKRPTEANKAILDEATNAFKIFEELQKMVAKEAINKVRRK